MCDVVKWSNIMHERVNNGSIDNFCETFALLLLSGCYSSNFGGGGGGGGGREVNPTHSTISLKISLKN